MTSRVAWHVTAVLFLMLQKLSVVWALIQSGMMS